MTFMKIKDEINTCSCYTAIIPSWFWRGHLTTIAKGPESLSSFVVVMVTFSEFTFFSRNNLELSKHLMNEVNHYIFIAKMCISKFKYGSPVDITYMFENEVNLRKLL